VHERRLRLRLIAAEILAYQRGVAFDGEQGGTGAPDLAQGGADDDLEVGNGDATLLAFEDVALPTGAILPLRVSRIFATGTTASGLVALW